MLRMRASSGRMLRLRGGRAPVPAAAELAETTETAGTPKMPEMDIANIAKFDPYTELPNGLPITVRVTLGRNGVFGGLTGSDSNGVVRTGEFPIHHSSD